VKGRREGFDCKKKPEREKASGNHGKHEEEAGATIQFQS
jgi:hypothetical protein